MYDVLIIGSGAAGLTAALNAQDNQNNIAILSKTYPTHSQTVQAQGGINAVLYEDEDSVEQHTLDTYNASKELSNKDNINFMCKNAKETITWLDSIGVPFNRNDKDLIDQRKFGGTVKIRTCYSSDYTGLKIVHTLYDQCIKNDINFINEHLLLDLIVDDQECKGAIVLDMQSGEIKEILSKTVILASGGYAGIYSNYTTNSYSNTADGIAVALRAGAKVSNLEFVQFHPTALLNSNILISESARGEGGYLVDEDGNRFVNELEARDKVARAIFEKIEKDEKVYLDLRHLGYEKIVKLMPQEYKLAYEFSNVKLDQDLLAINPAAHYSMGGIKVDINANTSIKNLYACGECAQADIHGANRLGGNSLLEIVTFGKVAGLNARESSKHINQVEEVNNQLEETSHQVSEIFNKENKINFYEYKDRLGHLMFTKVGLFKDENNLISANKDIENFIKDLSSMGIEDKSKIYNKNLVEYIEFKNMLEVSTSLIQCALLRKESRGSHFRSDYTSTNDEYKKNSVVQIKKNKLEITFEEIV